ncbi:MBL fold metallo-hydrolase [Telluribacter sp.]|jgi:glyoxylase-like metal-dependent hydrolase (beta-lactamase superfamily II)|uniref:MBL fold metallo-hydrolase n=1 Tax=Telluribacter sp. TaxID=1978767 RepID=UPI002E0DFF0A|nr:MBL fold metallo-hydrolase [Telluribacter sp.]
MEQLEEQMTASKEQQMTASKEAYFEVAEGVWGLKDYMVNVYMIQNQHDKSWVLVDAGLKTSASKIKKMARKLFGEQSRPEAIVLTHGHFDHVGSLKELAEEWDVKVYAHEMEMPYLTGKSSYPPPDSTVGGGMMAWMADIYPKSPINIKHRVEQLPNNDTIPGLSGWKYIHTPGHAPGHVSLWQAKNKVLIAGDAFVTTRQESARAVLMQEECISGPPKYFTYDWTASEQSVKKLAELRPEIVATGHGKPMQGEAMLEKLTELSDHFREQAVPTKGRYKDRPAVVNASGVVFVPPAEETPYSKPMQLASIVGVVAVALILFSQRKRIFS